MGTFILVLLTISGLFLMFIILLQRGRGGGLAGALGGAGGQSAFGTKAGDVFTRITIGVAVFWVVLACVSIFVVKPNDLYKGDSLDSDPPAASASSDADKKDADDKGDTSKAEADSSEESGAIDLDAIQKETQPATDTSDAATAPPEKKE